MIKKQIELRGCNPFGSQFNNQYNGTNIMSEQITQARKYLYTHTTPETAYVVEGYPWGFRLKTTIRYWVESKDAKNGGQRFVSQTINPKTGKWCAPKPTTYSPITIMFLDEKNHVSYECLRFNDDENRVKRFKEIHFDFMSDFQKHALCEIMAYTTVMKNVTFTVTPSKYGSVSLTSRNPEDIEKRKLLVAEQEIREKEAVETYEKINKAICHHYKKNRTLFAQEGESDTVLPKNN